MVVSLSTRAPTCKYGVISDERVRPRGDAPTNRLGLSSAEEDIDAETDQNKGDQDMTVAIDDSSDYRMVSDVKAKDAPDCNQASKGIKVKLTFCSHHLQLKLDIELNPLVHARLIPAC